MTHKKQFGFSPLLLCVAPLSHGIPEAADKRHCMAYVYLILSHNGSRALIGLGIQRWAGCGPEYKMVVQLFFSWWGCLGIQSPATFASLAQDSMWPSCWGGLLAWSNAEEDVASLSFSPSVCRVGRGKIVSAHGQQEFIGRMRKPRRSQRVLLAGFTRMTI